MVMKSIFKSLEDKVSIDVWARLPAGKDFLFELTAHGSLIHRCPNRLRFWHRSNRRGFAGDEQASRSYLSDIGHTA
jgi:hypothetical protein